MKNNKFLTAVLTVIALNLSLQTIETMEFLPKLKAAEKEPNSTKTLPELDPHSVWAKLPLNEDGSLNVRVISADEIDVNITDISTYDEMRVSIEGVNTSEELSVNIDEIGGSSVYSGGPIKVKIAQ